MFPGFSPIPHGFTSMHQQRMDGFCTLANGMRCGVIIRDRRLIIMAGEHLFDLTNILQHSTCLGVRALGNAVATLTNPILLVVVTDLGTSTPSQPQLSPAIVVMDAEGNREMMINAVKIFYEGAERSILVASNGGLLGVIRMRQGQNSFLKTIRFHPVAVNDLDVKFVECNGYAHVVTVSDNTTITLHCVDLYPDSRAAASSSTDSPSSGGSPTLGAHAGLTEETCAVTGTVLSTYIHPHMEGCFTYCAFSCCGRFVAASADASKMVVVCDVSVDLAELSFWWAVPTTETPFRVIPAANSRFLILCKRQILVLDPVARAVVPMLSEHLEHFVGMSDASLSNFTAVMAKYNGRTLQQEIEIPEEKPAAAAAGGGGLAALHGDFSTYTPPSTLARFASDWLRIATGGENRPTVTDLTGDALRLFLDRSVFPCSCAAGGLLRKQTVQVQPIPALGYCLTCGCCRKGLQLGQKVRRCMRCNGSFCMQCLPTQLPRRTVPWF